jgi:hypothetical protein
MTKIFGKPFRKIRLTNTITNEMGEKILIHYNPKALMDMTKSP